MKKTVAALLVLCTLTACNLGKDFARPEMSLPGSWKKGDKVTLSQHINPDWWTNFKSAELNMLMTEALAQNLDLKASLNRIRQSRATARIAGSALLPAIDASGSLGGTETRANGAGRDGWTTSGRAGLDVSYELDLFGGNRAGVNSARALVRNSEFNHDALALIVMSDVAQIYFQFLNLRERLALAERTQKNIAEVLKVADARFNAGSTSAIDVSRQRTELANAQAGVAALRNQVNATENALSVLLARPPQNLGLKGWGLGGIAVPKVPLTQPADILVQRPDIRAAEALLVAANADITAARAAFFPRVDIGTGIGLALSPLGGPATNAIDLLASIVAPIFHGGALEGGVERATAREMELAENYRKVVLTSLQEIEDALSAVKAARSRQGSFSTAVREAKRTYELSRGLYEAGSVDYQTMLEAQRSLFSANDNYASVKLELLNAEVDLYRALGGGWISNTSSAAATRKAGVQKK
ncbi:MAG TPA: efflux transporter outer membrane subunit [Patescibacteria group bacterium]|nr:efflux transporter outer membrane subunit [Patescibacteria group bacterium]